MSKYAYDGRWRTGLIAAVAIGAVLIVGALALYFFAYSANLTALLVQGVSLAGIFALPFDGSIWMYVLLVSGAVALGVSSSRARQRMRQRALAFAGDRNAVPLAKVTGDDERATATEPTFGWTLMREPLRLGWREQQYTKQQWAPLIGCLGIFAALASAGLFVVGILFLASAWSAPLSGAGFVVVIVTIPLAVCLTVGISMWRVAMRLAKAGPTAARDENELFADSVGVTWRRPGKSGVALRWNDARLLEVALTFSGKTTPAWRVYTLWGADGRSIAWPVFNVGAATTQRDAADEPARVALADANLTLLHLIHERAGLTARTFDAALLADARQARPWFSTLIGDHTSTAFGSLPLYFLMGVGPLSGALVALLLPLTNVPWVNVYGAVSLLIVGVLCLRQFRVWRQRSRRLVGVDTHELVLPAAPSSPNSDALYTLAQRPSFATMLVTWLLAPMCILDGVVALVALIMPGSHYSAQSIGSSLVFSTNFTLATTMIGGIIGLLIGISAVGPRRIVAGPERLSQRHEGATDPQVSILWPKVTAIIAITQRAGRVTGYRVIGDGGIGKDEISWRCDPHSVIATPSPRLLLQRAQSVTPGELAALVVARTGLPLEAREA